MGIWGLTLDDDALSVASSLATILGFAIVAFQQIRSRKLIEQQTRPYVYLECRKVTKDSKAMVALQITNVGKTPAYDVNIVAEPEQALHALSGSSKLPFVNPNAALDVLPGQRLTYLIGSAAKTSDFPLAKGIEVTVAVQYGGRKAGKRYSEKAVLTLSTSSFLVGSEI
jgi:hypothetical protein